MSQKYHEKRLNKLAQQMYMSTISSKKLLVTQKENLQLTSIVRPTLSYDLTLIENDFVTGYCERAMVFYVSTKDEQRLVQIVTNADRLA